MDDFEESYMTEVEKEVDEIRSSALKLVQQTHPEIEHVIDRRTIDDYSEKIWDYPGKWYPYFKLPNGFQDKEELIRAVAEETVQFYQKMEIHIRARTKKALMGLPCG